MSTYIIDRIAALKIPKALTGHYDDLFVLATKGGDSNTAVISTGKSPSRWNPVQAGQDYQCLAKSCLAASDFCGGMVRFSVGKSTPELFIGRCRKAMEEAPDYNSGHGEFSISDPRITFTRECKRDYYYDRIAKVRPFSTKEKVYLLDECEVFRFNLSDPKDVALWINLLPYGTPLGHHMTILGR